MESKNRTGEGSSSRKLGLSCAECRRSKLKCDRSFPCQSCIRRGCAGICPEGTLAATKGNKVLMAHAQRLSEQVDSLKAKIRELEISLAKAQGIPSSPGSDPSGLPGVDPSDAGVSDAFGSLSIGANGQAKYHGESASSEYFQGLLASSDDEEVTPSANSGLELPDEIIQLMNTFPFGMKECPYTKNLFLEFVPSKDFVARIAQLYFVNFAWLYDFIPIAEFNTRIINPIYGANPEHPSLDTIHSHQLAVFFMVLANGLLADEQSSSLQLSRQFHALGRAAMALDPLVSEATCATIQTIFLSCRWLYTCDRSGTEDRWILTGVNTRLAHSLGLQRDGSNWNLEPEEIQRRRRVFWELFVWESWGSLVNGRPAALSIQYVDCLLPDDLEPHVRPTGEVELGWNSWKQRYAAACISASSTLVFGLKSPSYTALLDLDKKIRGFPVPDHLNPSIENGRYVFSTSPSLAAQQLAIMLIKETNLLYFHRSYFAQAIRQAPHNPLEHKYTHSVISAYDSAMRVVTATRDAYHHHRLILNVTWYFWSSVFSACIVLGALVVESPMSTLAPDALRGLQVGVPLYEEGSRTFGDHASVVALGKLLHRAITAFSSSREGEDTTRVMSSTNIDDLEVLSGRRTVIAKTTKGSLSPKGHTSTGNGNPAEEASTMTSSPDLLAEFFKPNDQPMQAPPQDYTVLSYPPNHNAQYRQKGGPYDPPVAPDRSYVAANSGVDRDDASGHHHQRSTSQSQRVGPYHSDGSITGWHPSYDHYHHHHHLHLPAPAPPRAVQYYMTPYSGTNENAVHPQAGPETWRHMVPDYGPN